ncbi:hypothetical protein [Chitinivorax sp. B]|uniref:hypothetical protein n=1 Tax=Chitinivorax sp. B TaxID=2502235 RepID=UPI0010F753E3|nr:hypothetical protein [Chitinivorax sp. B]
MNRKQIHDVSHLPEIEAIALLRKVNFGSPYECMLVVQALKQRETGDVLQSRVELMLAVRELEIQANRVITTDKVIIQSLIAMHTPKAPVTATRSANDKVARSSNALRNHQLTSRP